MNQLAHQYGTYERQEELLQMIKDIDTLLTDSNIEYSLCGGTLLGAVRENGFIPWDDDVDIMVDRTNYNKIRALFGNNTISKYILRQYLWIDRIQKKEDKREGLYAATIDVFVMDNCPDNPILRIIKLLLVMVLQGMMKEKQIYDGKSLPFKFCLWLTNVIGKMFSAQKKFDWYQTVAQIGDSRASQYLGGYTDLFKSLSKIYKSNMFDKIDKHVFEDMNLPIIAEYDEYLRTQYGDYMTPPEEDKRVSIHMI